MARSSHPSHPSSLRSAGSHHGELIVAGPAVLRPAGPARPSLSPSEGGEH